MGWLSGWRYRKAFTYSRSVGAVTNYQILLSVGESVTSTGDDVHCEGHCLATFNDIRVTASDGITLLDYWIQEITGSTPGCTAKIWIELDTINTIDTTFYLYYGYSDASAYSNGDNTFVFFDHFDDATINTDKWTVVQGDVTLASSHLVLTGTAGTRGLLECKTGIEQSKSIISKAYFNTTAIKTTHFTSIRSTGDWANRGFDLNGNSNANELSVLTYDAMGNKVTVITGMDFTASSEYKVHWTPNRAKVFCDGTLLATITDNVSAGTQYLVMNETNDASIIGYVDYIFIRNFELVVPSFGTFGSEERIPCVNLMRHNIIPSIGGYNG